MFYIILPINIYILYSCYVQCDYFFKYFGFFKVTEEFSFTQFSKKNAFKPL